MSHRVGKAVKEVKKNNGHKKTIRTMDMKEKMKNNKKYFKVKKIKIKFNQLKN